MTPVIAAAVSGSAGRCPADQRAARGSEASRPRRLHRTRRARNFTPPGAVYVGRPTIFANPFAGRRRIGHKRSVILFAAWLRGDLTPRVLAACGFGPDERASLSRRREKLLRALPRLAGRNLQCWCPLTSDWCHAEALLQVANTPNPATYQ